MTTTRTTDSRRRLVDELVTKARLLALVNGVLRTTLAARSLPEVLAALAPNLKEVCPFDRLSVSLFDPRRKLFHTPYEYLKAKVVETNESPRGAAATPAGEVIRTQRPLLRRDAKRDPAPLATDTATLKRMPGCEAIFPLLAGELAFGTFQVGCLERDRLQEVHLEHLTELMPAVAATVHRFAGIIP
jgi:GAF domain-containing protein